ncbi:type I restriction endonuclease subunit S [Acinetobacter sp. WCHA55]|uniref:restriction endonuclease subunit S n=1 Tax=Acinetobacter sp. WCHA55 TaxID=2004646 RepID=UPI000B3C7D65|nr:restriction endonuclease subunit S [Acinetobacter sp. WCHA55]AYA67565.1 type I restriction endonuclease subunit S [Acinetobacter sp. WCHA55]
MSQKEWLPNGWVIAKVGDYLFLKNGFAFKSNSYVQPNDVTYPVIRISDIDGMYASDADAIHVSDPVVGFEVCKGDLLIAMSGATTGKIGVYKGKEPAFQNQRVGNLKLRSDKLGSTRFRNYLIASLSENILKEAYGGAQPNISGKAIENMEIQLPPLAEQKVIADKLDTLLAQVESIKARLERIPEILKQFRQSILAAAVSGKLTEEWREEQQLANWATTTLDSLILESANGLSKRTGVSGDEVTILRLADFKDAVRVHGNERVIKLDEKEKKKYALEKGDILIIRVNGSVDLAGRFIEYTPYDKMEGFCDHFIRIRLDTSRVNSTYLTFVANHGDGRHYLKNSLSTSAGQNTINQGSIKGLELLLPSIQEQELVVSRVSNLFKYTVVIEEQVQSALDRVNNLTQSTLAKAFRGELTAEWRESNPELISGENSAEALLERIKAERSAKAVTKRGRGKA